jgi:hypothetical protein
MNTKRMKSYIWTCLVVEVIEDKCFLSLLKMKWETTAGLGFVFFCFGGFCDGKYGEVLPRVEDMGNGEGREGGFLLSSPPSL